MNVFTGGCHYDENCGKFAARCGACPQLGSAAEHDLSREVWLRKQRAFEQVATGNLHVVAEAVAKWLEGHNCDLQRTDIKMFFEQLALFVAAEEFELKAPTRAEFSKYMERCTKLYWTENRWRLRLMNVVNTVMAPLVGCHKFSTMYKAELRIIDFLQRHIARQT